MIVELPNAIIDEFAVVVKNKNASIASNTVLTTIVSYWGVAGVTKTGVFVFQVFLKAF